MNKGTAENTAGEIKKDVEEPEVVEFYAGLLRMQGDAKVSEALKAAEFFVKYLKLFEKQQAADTKKVVIVDDIAKVKEELDA